MGKRNRKTHLNFVKLLLFPLKINGLFTLFLIKSYINAISAIKFNWRY
ncbi:hypothetical protein pb186bvf_019597 [Paramecium bursaria]